MDFKQYRFTALRKEEEDIMSVEYIDHLTVDIEIARELVSNRIEFAYGKDHYLIIDLSNGVKEVSREAKEYLQDPEGGLKGILGSAFIVSNPISVLLANIFVKSKRNNAPSRYFTNKADALQWIKELKARNI